MRLTVPDYYDRFRCIASRCTDNCCIGWEIGIDPAALADYQSQPGAFGGTGCGRPSGPATRPILP